MKLSASEIAKHLDMSVRFVRVLATKEAWQFEQESNSPTAKKLYLLSGMPLERQVKIRESMANNQKVVAHTSTVKTQEKIKQDVAQSNAVASLKQMAATTDETAKTKANIVLLAQNYVAENGFKKEHGFTQFAEKYNKQELDIPSENYALVSKVSRSTLYHWESLIKKGAFNKLQANYGNRKGSLKINETAEIREFCEGLIYDNPHLKPTHMQEAILVRFQQQISYSACQRWLSQWKKDNAEAYQYIMDPDKWNSKYMPAFGSARQAYQNANDLWEFDSTPTDLMLNVFNKEKRYSLLGVIDVGTERVKVIVRESSNSEGISLLIRNTILEWGVPKEVKTDNGADYKSNQTQAAFKALEIKQNFCKPYSGWEKPHIERFFKTFSHGMAELLGGYIGHNVTDRQAIENRKSFAQRLIDKKAARERIKNGEELDTINVNLTPEELQSYIDDWVNNYYHHKPHSTLKGKTPNEVYQQNKGSIRYIPDEHILDVLLSPIPGQNGIRTIVKQGIKLENSYYVGIELGAYPIGHRVFCRWDPNQPGSIFVFDTITNQFICKATDREYVDADNLTNLAHTVRRNRVSSAKAEKRRLEKQAKKHNTSNIAAEHRDYYNNQNGSIAQMPKPVVEHETSLGSEIKKASRKRKVGHTAEQITEFQARRQQMLQMEKVEQAAMSDPQPLFATPYHRAMWIKRESFKRELTPEEKSWLANWTANNTESAKRMEALLEEQGLIAGKQN